MVLFDILIFVVVLGLLVFFHELGHFLAAKACGIYVDRFSLGMPPRVFGITIGETDYCIGALPIGGYVKMAGQEDAPLTDEEREKQYGHVPEHRWFSNKPVWQRFIVILAGPVMNLVLAVLLYGIVVALGAEVPETEVDNRIGFIEPDSPAASAPLYPYPADGKSIDYDKPPVATGWATGDRVVAVNGETMTNIMDVAIEAMLAGGKALSIEIERTQADGKKELFLSPVAPKPLKEDGHPRFGISPFDTPLVGAVLTATPASAQGIQPDDIIQKANGKTVDQTTFVKLIEQYPEGQPVSIEILRGDKTVNVDVTPETVGRILGVVFTRDNESKADKEEDARPAVAAVSPDTDAAKLLRAGDIIETIDGQPATFKLLNDLERARPGGTIKMDIRRPAVLMGYAREEESKTIDMPIAAVRAIGVQFKPKMVFHRVPAIQVPTEAFRLGCQAFMRTLQTLQMLVTGNLSPKDLGGPVLIYQATTTAAREGYWWLFNMTAFISANLCVFNLLPLPILDGGLLVYLLIEAIRRKPLDVRVLEWIQRFGLVLILLLLVLVTYNDISRWVVSRLQ